MTCGPGQRFLSARNALKRPKSYWLPVTIKAQSKYFVKFDTNWKGILNAYITPIKNEHL